MTLSYLTVCLWCSQILFTYCSMEDSKRLLLNDPDVVAARLHQLEVTQQLMSENFQSFIQTITKMNATITDLKQSLSVMQGL